MDGNKLKISASPHVRGKDTTSDIMFDVIIALVPATVIGVYQFGWYAGLLVAVCILSAVLAEFIYQRAMKKPVLIGDFSAVVTGLLVALNLPPGMPVWMAMLGSIFAIIIVKQLFGGLGQNFMNPALGARCFLLLAFSKYMTNFTFDGVSTATPLAVLKEGGTVDIFDMFIGKTAGTIGEVSAAALLIGAVYLLVRKVISPRIPLTYIGTFAICIAIYALVNDIDVIRFTLAHLCGGGLMLGAWFMATDYVTSPVTPNGKYIYGVILGLLTFVLRIYGGSAEGVSYAIIISNLLVPLIEKVSVPRSFGKGAELSAEERKKLKADEKLKKAKTKEEALEEKPLDNEKMDALNEKLERSSKVRGIAVAVLALFVITVIMGAGLGMVYDITKKPIQEANEKAKEEAYMAVMPEADRVKTYSEDELSYENISSYMAEQGYGDNTFEEIGIAYDADGKEKGIIMMLKNSQGYGGDIELVVGIDLAGNITGISFLELNETVGLGMEAADEEFISQFIGKGVYPFTYTKTGASTDSEIDAISGATITTSAVTDAVNAALCLYVNMMQGVSEQ